MKKIFTLLAFSLVFGKVSAQDAKNIGIGTSQPDKSAVLDIQSSEKGLLIPRLSIEQRNQIEKPATGLLIFQNDLKESGFYYFNGEAWKPLTTGAVNAMSTLDANGWALDGNVTSTANKAAATTNSFIGTPAGVPLVIKVGNARVAYLTNESNLFLGTSAGFLNQGTENIGIGYGSLRYNTTGSLNTALGSESLNQNTTGSSNFSLGRKTLQNNTNGSINLAIGGHALLNNKTGSFNVAIGNNALHNNISGTNNVAVGLNAGFSSLGSQNVFLGNLAGYNETSSNKLYIANSNTPTPLIYGDFSAKFLSIGDVPVAKRDAVASSGNYSLIVEKGILSEKLKVALKSSTDWADYVFEPEYKANMMSLEEVEAFTLKNKHLPKVPSADELVEKGLDFNETSKMFMEKIEELTLYMIELNKEVKALKKENEALKSKIK